MNDIWKVKSGIYVFEGIDNVGKTTIAHSIKRIIEDRTGKKSIVLSFPGKSARTLGALVYDIHHNQKNYFNMKINDVSMQLLHVASHIDVLKSVILPMSRKNVIILLDRFWWSTYAYGLANGISKTILNEMIGIERKFWEDIPINKIFYIQREDRDDDLQVQNEEAILGAYNELVLGCTYCCVIRNEKSIENAIYDVLEEMRV